MSKSPLSLDTTVTTDKTTVLGKTVVTTGVAAIPGVLAANDTIFSPAVKGIDVVVNKSVLVVCCNPVVNIAVAEATDVSVTGGDVGGVTVLVVTVVTMDGVVVIWEERLGEPEVAVVVFAPTVEMSGLWVAVPVMMELLVTPDIKVGTTPLLPEEPPTTVLQVTDIDDVTVAAAGNPVCTAVEMGEIFPNKFELEDIPPGKPELENISPEIPGSEENIVTGSVTVAGVAVTAGVGVV